MKPIIVTKNTDGKLDLTEEQLEKLIDCAYHNGYEDGLKAQTAIKLPVNVNEPWYPWTMDHIVITCETPKVTL